MRWKAMTRPHNSRQSAAVNGSRHATRRANDTHPVERRSAPRVDAAQLPGFSAQLVDGPTIEVVNASRTGVLTRSEARLMPGAMIGLRILTADDTVVIFGRVVRSRLLTNEGEKPYYESALALSRDFPLLAASSNTPAAIPEPQDVTP